MPPEDSPPSEPQGHREPAPTDAPQDAPAPRRKTWDEIVFSLRWPLVVLTVALILAGLALRLAGGFSGSLGSLFKTGTRLADGFQSGTITTTFRSELPELVGPNQGSLEVAVLNVTETLTREDSRRVLWQTVDLGTTVTEIRVPVVYRYHLPLDETWTVEVDGTTCVVFAPRLQPSLPPAMRTDGIEKRTERSWLRLNAEQQMKELEQSLTPTLETMAADPHHLGQVREHARNVVAEFVRNWLLREEHWRDDRFRAIKVYFPDESPYAAGDGPVLRLEDSP